MMEKPEIKKEQNEQQSSSSSFKLFGALIIPHLHDHNTEQVQLAPATIAHTFNGGCDVHNASSSTIKQEQEDLTMMVNQPLISDSEPPAKNQNPTMAIFHGQPKYPTLLFDGQRHSSPSFKLFGTPIHLIPAADQTHSLIPADSELPTKKRRFLLSFGLAQNSHNCPALKKMKGPLLLEDALPNTARCSVTATNSGAAAAPELPPQFYDQITRVHGGTNIKLLTEKRLERTDLSESHSRLALPQSSISRDNINFLTEAEAKELLVKNANGKLGSIGVTVIDPKLNPYEMKLGKWFYRQSKNSKKRRGFSYSLKAGWSKVLECNKFEVGDVLQIWSFRIGAQLGIAIVATAPPADIDVAAPLFPTWGRRAPRT